MEKQLYHRSPFRDPRKIPERKAKLLSEEAELRIQETRETKRSLPQLASRSTAALAKIRKLYRGRRRQRREDLRQRSAVLQHLQDRGNQDPRSSLWNEERIVARKPKTSIINFLENRQRSGKTFLEDQLTDLSLEEALDSRVADVAKESLYSLDIKRLFEKAKVLKQRCRNSLAKIARDEKEMTELLRKSTLHYPPSAAEAAAVKPFREALTLQQWRELPGFDLPLAPPRQDERFAQRATDMNKWLDFRREVAYSFLSQSMTLHQEAVDLQNMSTSPSENDLSD